MVGSREEVGSVCSTFYDLFRDSPMPSKNGVKAFPKKVCPGIQTWLVRTECHRSTAYATTTALGIFRSKKVRFVLK